MGQTIVEKLTEYHLVETPPEKPVREGDFVSIWPLHVMTHDNTAAVMKKFAGLGVKRIRAHDQPVIVLDHDIQNTTETNLDKYRAIETFAREQGLSFYPAGTGIGHQVMMERGYVFPGAFVVASDSHANMYGALSAVGTPVVRTDAAMIWATGQFWWQVPRTVQVVLKGSLPPGVTGKDVILTLCGMYNQGEVLNAAVEFGGPGVTSLSMDDRFTIANMTTEWGALVGWFPTDAVTLDYLSARCREMKRRGVNRLTEVDVAGFREDPPVPDPDAQYAARIVLNLEEVTPYVSGPDTVQTAAPLAEVAKRHIEIEKAYLVSCVNSRLSDIRQAAEVLRGKKVAPGVEFYVAAASKDIQQAAEAEGWWSILIEAGAIPLPSGCGPCIGLGAGLLEPGEVGISATNRNFKGRMGSSQASCYLASPPVVAASAAAGFISGPKHWTGETAQRDFEAGRKRSFNGDARVDIIEGFPPRVEGRLVYLSADNLNTDGIYGKDYTYREDMTAPAMARVVFENYDPEVARQTRAGDILVGGFNFGTGSSREQAVTALKAKGYALVVAASFSQTYLRNAFNNGFICIECPDLVLSLRQSRRDDIASERTFLIDETPFEIDFYRAVIRWGTETFTFPPLGRVPQSLVVAGGVENMIRGGVESL
jgi:homoaconitate hydratase